MYTRLLAHSDRLQKITVTPIYYDGNLSGRTQVEQKTLTTTLFYLGVVTIRAVTKTRRHLLIQCVAV